MLESEIKLGTFSLTVANALPLRQFETNVISLKFSKFIQFCIPCRFKKIYEIQKMYKIDSKYILLKLHNRNFIK